LNSGEVYVTGKGSSYTTGMRTTLNTYNLYSFIGPIIRNVQDMNVSGSLTGTCVFLRTDGTVYITGQTSNGLCFLNGTVTSARPSCTEAFFNFERVYCSSLYTLACSPCTTIGCVTLDSNLILAGNINTVSTSLGTLPAITPIYTFAEPLLNERIVDVYFAYNSSSTVAATLVRVASGRIYACGYSGITGVTEDLTTFVQLPIDD
jgi:hypothetical protein